MHIQLLLLLLLLLLLRAVRDGAHVCIGRPGECCQCTCWRSVLGTVVVKAGWSVLSPNALSFVSQAAALLGTVCTTLHALLLCVGVVQSTHWFNL
jgi:hypothetical protein